MICSLHWSIDFDIYLADISIIEIFISCDDVSVKTIKKRLKNHAEMPSMWYARKTPYQIGLQGKNILFYEP